ncbi:MAG: hypothetical protein L7S55_09185 [Luminiphilus sp.]|nr:hypothetical protein [Luminiphilus sp.]
MKQLTDLVKRIPEGYIKTKPGGFQADYVSHADIQQILLAKLGPCSQEVTRVITNSEGVVQGCVLRVLYVIDGQQYVIEEAGDVERPGANNGSNLKNAVSDAVKRCAMRVGVGLHLWSQDNYVLDKVLTEDSDADS